MAVQAAPCWQEGLHGKGWRFLSCIHTQIYPRQGSGWLIEILVDWDEVISGFVSLDRLLCSTREERLWFYFQTL